MTTTPTERAKVAAEIACRIRAELVPPTYDPSPERMTMNSLNEPIHPGSDYSYPNPPLDEPRLKNRAFYRRAAQKGARFLDEIEPGWADLIDTRILDMSNNERCIGGQIQLKREASFPEFSFPEFSSPAFHRFCQRRFDHLLELAELCELGFVGLCLGHGEDGVIEMARMRSAWMEQIEQRADGKLKS